jgi:antitoxin component of RelBE/YafQ-DinJ toxin-antitoxin module
MARGTTVTARINPALKKSVEEILGKLGISHSEVINMLYSLISLRKGLRNFIYTTKS